MGSEVTSTISESIDIEASPDAVYRLVIDITAVGRRSPECWRCVWLGDERGVGARFRGWNRRGLLRWSTVCQVEAADGCEFCFAVVDGAAGRRTRWRYRVDPQDGGSRVTEACEPISINRAPALGALLAMLRGGGDRSAEVRRGMQTTLVNLKREAESAVDHRPRAG